MSASRSPLGESTRVSVTPTPFASIVVPAHDEEGALGANLVALLHGAGPSELDVVVVANGCTDRTAEVARGAGVRVIETPRPGKAHALRLGDAVCATFPRLYLDADVRIDLAGVRAVVAALGEPGVLAAAPSSVLDLRGSSPLMRRAHRVHEQLVGPRRGLSGVGMYAVNRQGHARAFPVPEVIADDEWVQRSFTAAERRVVAAACTVVRPAPTLRSYLRRRARVREGNAQLARLGLAPAGRRLHLADIVPLVRQHQVSVADAACYLVVTGLDRTWFLLRRTRHPGRRDPMAGPRPQC